jgi:hypothetical protein|tara:strand:- start:1462 stop:1713 length:252 start_codon:yes stop_codon:yes gene_type:complete
MYNFKIGDLVAKKHPSDNIVLKTGIVISESDADIVIKWFSYNKDFFMEKTHDIFYELNKYYLLSTQSISRNNEQAFLCLLNSN